MLGCMLHGLQELPFALNSCIRFKLWIAHMLFVGVTADSFHGLPNLLPILCYMSEIEFSYASTLLAYLVFKEWNKLLYHFKSLYLNRRHICYL